MLADFTLETFAGRLGETFRVGEGVDALDLELVEVTVGIARPHAGGRVPFSLVFRGPLEPVLPQRMYRFEHAELGTFELFIVPLGPDEDGMRYEAVFG
jgi:hypothetical protein